MFPARAGSVVDQRPAGQVVPSHDTCKPGTRSVSFCLQAMSARAVAVCMAANRRGHGITRAQQPGNGLPPAGPICLPGCAGGRRFSA